MFVVELELQIIGFPTPSFPNSLGGCKSRFYTSLKDFIDCMVLYVLLVLFNMFDDLLKKSTTKSWAKVQPHAKNITPLCKKYNLWFVTSQGVAKWASWKTSELQLRLLPKPMYLYVYLFFAFLICSLFSYLT